MVRNKTFQMKLNRNRGKNALVAVIIFFLLFSQLYVTKIIEAWLQLGGSGDTTNKDHPGCALLFFGLVVEFESLVYPSIKRHILDRNPDCDIFLHTYNITTLPYNPRNGGNSDGTLLNVSQVTQLTSEEGHVQFESMDSFFQHRQGDLDRTRVNYSNVWGECCISHDNMIKQWHSIKAVWDLMEAHADKEQKKMSSSTTQEGPYYEHVGFFRLDVYYVAPIDISNSIAVIPDFANWPINDRLFYGKYTFAEMWANRFRFVPTFEKNYMGGGGLHSETFLQNLLEHHEIPYEESPDICFLRVRSGPRRVLLDDCRDNPSGKFEFENWDQIHKLAPEIDVSLVPNARKG